MSGVLAAATEPDTKQQHVAASPGSGDNEDASLLNKESVAGNGILSAGDSSSAAAAPAPGDVTAATEGKLSNGDTASRGFHVVNIIGDKDPAVKSETMDNSSAAPDGARSRKPGTIHLYDEESEARPLVTSILSDLINYNPVLSTPEVAGSGDKKAAPTKPQLGTVVGVYLPTMQNIFGVLLFLRLSWIVGTAGVPQAFCIVLLCCTCTMLTAISMSAIATNGYVPAGGSYFMISRALGPEFGGAVGILFFLGTSFAASMYIIGAVEILLTYISQDISLFGEIGGTTGEVSPIMLNNMRVYGSLFLIAMATLVYVGVKYVNKLAGVFLACVLISVVCIYIGIFTVGNEALICVISGASPDLDVLVSLTGVNSNYSCSLNTTSSRPNLYDMFCRRPDGSLLGFGDCRLEYPFLAGKAGWEYGIQGITSGKLMDNLGTFYRSKGEVIPGLFPPSSTAAVTSDVMTSAMVLTGIFFPSCTGIMAGSNRSGDLKNAAASIPIGTIGAILTTGFVYLTAVVLFGAVATPSMLRDKFGVSVEGTLFCSQLAFPTKWVVIIGAFLSTIGAGLQSLTGAPRLLQAIAQDNIMPPLKFFAKGKKNGEPSWALLLSACIAEVGIIIAQIDQVAPIITIFFLMCYMFVNLACALQTLLRSPNWRPTFKFYHWSLSVLGMAVCLFIMFISCWWQALLAMVIATCLYKYIEYAGAKKEWGDGIRGLSLSAALYGLRRLEESEPHTKNWRPQILALVTPGDATQDPLTGGAERTAEARAQDVKAFPFGVVSQLKAGKGLTIIGSVIVGAVNKCKMAEKEEHADDVREAMTKNKVKGFVQVSLSDSYTSGYLNLMQLAGLGGLKPNTVLIQWPSSILNKEEKGFSLGARVFMNVLEAAAAGKQVLMAVKNSHKFPNNKQVQPSTGTIDIWWVVHDGGILMLLSFLLQQHKVWRATRMRIFTIAQPEDNSVKIKQDLIQFLKLVRITAEVDVIEMPSDDISAYTYEKTLMMEQRTQLLQNLQMSRRESRREVQVTADHHRKTSQGTAASPVHAAGETGGKFHVSTVIGATIPEESAVSSRPPTTPIIEVATPTDDVTGPGDNVEDPTCLVDTVASSEGVLPGIGATGVAPAAGGASLSAGTQLAKPDEHNMKQMDAATKLNTVIMEKSPNASLLFINLPAAPPRNPRKFYNYLNFVEALTKDLTSPIVLVRGSGREFVTIYS